MGGGFWLVALGTASLYTRLAMALMEKLVLISERSEQAMEEFVDFAVIGLYFECLPCMWSSRNCVWQRVGMRCSV